MRLPQSLRRHTTASARLRFARWWFAYSGLDVLDHGNGALVPQPVDLLNLYWNVRRRRPRTILEFGIGHSTIVMAAALRRNGIGRIVTVDANAQWIEQFNRQVPAGLRPIIDVHHCRLESMTYESEACHRYIGVPDVFPDFMYLDGPDYRDVPDWHDNQIAVDPVLMEATFPRGFRLIVDTRLDNCAFLDRHFKRKYHKRYDDIFKIVTYDLDNSNLEYSNASPC